MWGDAERLAYWQRCDDLAIVAIRAAFQFYNEPPTLFFLALSVRPATKLAPQARASRPGEKEISPIAEPLFAAQDGTEGRN